MTERFLFDWLTTNLKVYVKDEGNNVFTLVLGLRDPDTGLMEPFYQDTFSVTAPCEEEIL